MVKDMYYLMNKDNIILTFQTNPESGLSEDVSFSVVKQEGCTPYGFQSITAWVESSLPPFPPLVDDVHVAAVLISVEVVNQEYIRTQCLVAATTR